uniref:BURP domain-containing protein n=1 Tax=Leersia perrieri TaxID=77586 RepID=A0A0D9WP93_9ORYZ
MGDLQVVTEARDLLGVQRVELPNSASMVTKYWREMLPHSPMPSAILELLNPPSDVNQGVQGNGYDSGYINGDIHPNGNGYSNDVNKGVYGNGYTQAYDKGYDRGYINGNIHPNDVNKGVYGNGYTQAYGNGYSHSYINGDIHSDSVGYSNSYDRHPNLHFLEDALKPGSIITPYITGIATRAPFLRRDIADSIPMSTKNFVKILSMFSPTSVAMANGIQSALETCEHHRPIEGEKRACATSIESVVEFAMSVLGTRDLRAFSPDVPAKGAMAGRRYKVAAVRTVAGSKGDTVACHTMRFPYAVFYCHAINPTRVYAVVLESEEGGTLEKMEALVVCHLDTSKFDPKNRLFIEHNLKPGDVSVCHFVSRDSVVWTPVGAVLTPGDEQASTIAE